MRKDVVWSGIILVVLGAVLVIVGGLINYDAYDKLLAMKYEDQVEGLNAVRNAEMLTSMGLFIALAGIAIWMSGMVVEEPARKVKEPARPEWRPAYQQEPIYPQQEPPQQYPPQP